MELAPCRRLRLVGWVDTALLPFIVLKRSVGEVLVREIFIHLSSNTL